MKAPMAAVRSLTERKVPRRMAWRVMLPKEDLHVQPGAGSRGEVQRDPQVLWPGEPLADLGVLVRALIVQHDVQVYDRVGSAHKAAAQNTRFRSTAKNVG